MRDRERERERDGGEERMWTWEKWIENIGTGKKVIRILVSPKIYSSTLYYVVLSRQGYLLRYC